MKMSTKLSYVLILSQVLLHSACQKTDLKVENYENGVFMPSKGIGGHSVANLSFFNRSNGFVETCLGSDYCSIAVFTRGIEIFNNRFYLLCDHSTVGQDFKVYDLSDLSLIQEIDITLPRAVSFINSDKAYLAHEVCALQNPTTPDCTPRISILNPQTNQIVGIVTEGITVYNMLTLDNGMVLASGDSFIYKFDSNLDQLLDSVPISGGPRKLVLDSFGMVWTLTSGSETEPVKLVRINPNSLIIEFESVIPGSVSSQWHQFSIESYSSLCTDESHQLLYWVFDSDIYRMHVDATQIPSTPFISGNYRLVGVDPLDDIIYCSKWSNQDSVGEYLPSYVHRFSNNGVILDSIQVGIGPVDFYFSSPQ